MARAPFQVLVFPYRPAAEDGLEYALLRRADEGYWHVVAGGGEGYESPTQAARRETQEEIGVGGHATLLPLDTVTSVPVTEFRDSYLWGEQIYVIPEYSFGVDAGAAEIRLSAEHTEVCWVTYEEALVMLHHGGNKVALWELDRRLRGLGPRD